MKRSVLKNAFLGLLAILLLGGFGWIVTQSGPLAPIKVTVERVSKQAIEASVFGIGTVEARYSYRLGPTAAGRVKQVLADVGDSVQAGQVVAEMDAVDLNARIQAAGLAVERATASIATAQATLKLADSENRRTASLASRKLISQSSADASEQEAAIARAALDVARKEQQRLQAEQQALQQQQVNLRISAPVAGIITSRDAEPGTALVAGQAILTLADPQSYWVKARIDQSQAQGLRAGQVASIVLRSSPQQTFAGKLARVEPLSDSITEERLVSVAFAEPPVGLSPGELAEVTIQTSRKADVLVIPNAALHQLKGETGVWKVGADNVLTFVPVQTGIQTLDGQVEILAGLQTAEQVVVYSQQGLTATSKIKVVDQLVSTPQ